MCIMRCLNGLVKGRFPAQEERRRTKPSVSKNSGIAESFRSRAQGIF
jgi:hypothetical protein